MKTQLYTVLMLAALSMIGCNRGSDIAPSAPPIESKTAPPVPINKPETVSLPNAPQIKPVASAVTEEPKKDENNYYHGLRPVHNDEYRSFSLIAPDGKTEMSSDEIERDLMCREPKGPTLLKTLMLFKTFEILDTQKMDDSLSMTGFAGRVGQKAVKVSMLTAHTYEGASYLSYVWVDGVEVMHCW